MFTISSHMSKALEVSIHLQLYSELAYYIQYLYVCIFKSVFDSLG